MKPINCVAVVNDLSGFGRCSLTVALPVLATMGFQPCPVPTAVLSAHTGYPNPLVRDMTGDMADYLAHWDTLGLDFMGVYTGFLGNERQVDILAPFLRRLAEQGRLRLVDPAMADHGRLYATCTPVLVEKMKGLVAGASVTTPNLTELCLLTDWDYESLDKDFTGEAARRRVEDLARTLLEKGCRSVVVTGLEEPGVGRVANCVVAGEGAPAVWVDTPCVARRFAGTGDVFASVLFGWLLKGLSLGQAVERAAAFVWQASAYTAQLDSPEQDGIGFEPFLRELNEEE